MASKIFNDFQGSTIRIDGVCYTFNAETTAFPNTSPSSIDGTFNSCLECEIDSSSSQSSESIGNFSSSTSSGNYSESSSESSRGYTSSSSESSESFLNFSSSESSSSSQSESSESINNFSSSSESINNFSSSESDGCFSVEILAITISDPSPEAPLISTWTLFFVPDSLPYTGQACVNGVDEGVATSYSISIENPVANYSVGQIVEVCEGECCYKGNYSRNCIYNLNETTLIWELDSFVDAFDSTACDKLIKCFPGNVNKVTQHNNFDTLEQRNNFTCPENPVGEVPEDCISDFFSSSSESFNNFSSSSESFNNFSSSSESTEYCTTGFFYLGRGPCEKAFIPESCYYVCKDDAVGFSVGDFIGLDGQCWAIESEFTNIGDNPAFCGPQFTYVLHPSLPLGPFLSCNDCMDEVFSSSSEGYSESSSSSGGGGEFVDGMMYSFTRNTWDKFATTVPPCPPVGSPIFAGPLNLVYDSGVWYHYEMYAVAWIPMTDTYGEHGVGPYGSPSDFTIDDCYAVPAHDFFFTLIDQTGPFTASPVYPS